MRYPASVNRPDSRAMKQTDCASSARKAALSAKNTNPGREIVARAMCWNARVALCDLFHRRVIFAL